MKKKNLKKILFVILVIFLGGLGGIVADKYLFPYLSSSKLFSKYPFLKSSLENVTIINKTEQVTIKEDATISQVSNQIVSTVVNIVSIPSVRKNVPVAEIKNGTGVVVTSDGLIMTYSGAINAENSTYKVLINENNSYDAKLIGVDSFSNLAFLKIDANNLPSISFGNSADARSGEKVVALGNSDKIYGIQYSSAILGNFDPYFNLSGQTLSSSEKLEGVYKTDFLSSPSLLGGPVVDYMGQVVGIIGSIQKNNMQTFFEIPANQIKLVIDRAIKNELTQNPILGISYKPLSSTDALISENSADKGALIYSASNQTGLAILTNSPAQKAGLQLNDIITAINDQEINVQNSLSNVLYEFKKGDEIILKILRAGEEVEIKVQL